MNYSTANPKEAGAKNWLEVAVQTPLRQTFTYAPPLDCNLEQCQPGARLWVPFGHRQLLGIVLQHTDLEPGLDPSRIRPAQTLLDEEPLLSKHDIELAQFVWTYYHLAPGQVLSWLLPPQLRKNKPFLPPPADPPAKNEAAASAPELCPLTDEQQQVLDALRAQKPGFRATLIQGVTGSGKTEIYLRRMDEILAAGKQVLYLVPEIGLAPQAEQRVRDHTAHSGISCASLHSRISNSRRLQIWNRARTGELDVLIGTRSAVFTPLPQLGLIIVDEEHDSSLRQEQSASYSARDLAVWRGQQRRIPVLLGSATPALETLEHARNGSYSHLQLRYRVDGQLPPPIEVIDRRKIPETELYSPQTMQLLRARLQEGKQVLLFLNRRGWARMLWCPECGWRTGCENCDAPAILHLHHNALICHHCAKRSPVPHHCPQCSSLLGATGAGTEKLEQWCKQQFPATPILRIDSDSTRSAGSLNKMLKEAQTRTPALLIGTRMLTKGHHLPHLGTVAIADASLGLFHPDFRTAELTAQTLIQVAGRAGREMRGGKVVMETTMPQHSLLQLLKTGDYPSVAGALLAQRRHAHLPPFSHLALVLTESSKRNDAMQMLQTLKKSLPKIAGTETVGPLPRAMEKMDKQWRAVLQLRSAKRPALQKLLSHLVPEADYLADKTGTRYYLIVDPLETL